MKNRGISIRYKILILLTVLPLITLTAYLVLAIRIFEHDKIAYVFDSSTNMSATMATQIKTQFNGVLGTAKPIFQEYILQKKFSTVAESIFRNEFNLEAVIVFANGPTPASFVPAAFLEKAPGQVKEMLTQLKGTLPGYLKEIQTSRRRVKVPFNDDRAVILEVVTDEASAKRTTFMVVTRASDMAEMFKSTTAQKIYLTDAQGAILFGPGATAGTAFQTVAQAAFLQNTASQVAQGAESVVDSSGVEQLVSYSRTGFGDLTVITTVEKSVALGAVQVLIRRSIIFFGILISLTVVVSLFASSGITQALSELFEATKKVSKGDFNIRVKVSSTDEVGALADNFNIMAAEVARLLEQTAEAARMETELQTARTVQETLFPESRARFGDLSIAGFYEPATECGGDWWHYCKIGNRIFLWIGDATGHGAPAALITSAAKSASTIIEKLNITPGQAMELLNRSIYDVSKGRIMMTFFLASFDLETGQFTYCNASHEAPFWIRAKAEGEALKKSDLTPLNEVNNPRLGQDRDAKFEQITIQIEKGDMVFFYTDGISDVQDPQKESWGERAFVKALITANRDYPQVEDSVERFALSLSAHRQGAALVDDVTFFVVKREVVH